jgi:baseplate J-like protein
MPIRPPILDDRSFDDLVSEALARIPAHTPEWTNPRLGDPGRTLIELFAWLTDTLLYRVNLIPERQRLAFLRLLGEHMRPAIPATGVITVSLDDPQATDVITISPFATVKGPVNFETRTELTVMPVTSEFYCKRPTTAAETAKLSDLLTGLQQVYGINGIPAAYVTTPLFPGNTPDPAGFDLIGGTVDKILWISLLAPKNAVDVVRAAIASKPISVGVLPSLEVPALFEDIGPRARIPHVWEISTGSLTNDVPPYLTLDIIADSTAGLARRGIERLLFPAKQFIGAPSNDVRQNLMAGVGDSPPRLDDPDKAARLVCWIRMRPTIAMQQLSLSWAGGNAVEIDQQQTIAGRVVGQSDGTPNQEIPLPATSVNSDSFMLQVEETDRGYVVWQQVDDLATAGRDDNVYTLNSEAGTVSFGNGMHGRIPDARRRVRVAIMRSGGGTAGNLAPGLLTDISAFDLTGAKVKQKLKVTQPMVTDGGADAETLAQAEQRIPSLFRHRDRAVTEADYHHLAREIPGISLGRVEVLARFKPQQRRSDVPGVVSVMVLPAKSAIGPPNPRPDRPFLENAYSYLAERRPVATELYVIGCEYIPLGISIGITIRDGFGHEAVLSAVTDAARQFMWPLAGGGIDGAGWPLGRSVRDREIDVAVARVSGVDQVNGINLFRKQADNWRLITTQASSGAIELTLEAWQLPELLSIVVVEGDVAGDLSGAPNPFAVSTVAVPVVPEVC